MNEALRLPLQNRLLMLSGITASVLFLTVTISPYKNLWSLTITSDNGRSMPTAKWSDEVRPITIRGRGAMMRRQVLRTRSGNTVTWINIFDPRTLSPIMSSLTNSAGNIYVRKWDGKRVQAIDGSGPNLGWPVETISAAKPGLLDFNGGMYGLLFLKYPLAKGFHAVMPVYGFNADTTEKVHFTVIDRKQVEAKVGMQATVWVVDAYYTDANRPEGDAKMTFWLSQTAPYIIRLVYRVPSTHQTWLYKMI